MKLGDAIRATGLAAAYRARVIAERRLRRAALCCALLCASCFGWWAFLPASGPALWIARVLTAASVVVPFAIQYTNANIYTQIAGDTVALLISGLSGALVAGGWTAASATPAFIVITFTGEPANNDTISLIGPTVTKTYTYKTTLTGAANEIHRGGSAAQDAINLHEAVTAGSGAGTDYGTGTTAHPEFTASDNGSGVLTLSASAALNGLRYRVTNSLTNTTPTGTTYELTSSSQILTTGTHSQGLGMRIRLVSWNQGGGAFAGIVAGSADGSVEDPGADSTNMMCFLPAASRTLEVFADPIWAAVWLLNSSNTQGTEAMFGTGFVADGEAPGLITGVTGSGNANGWHSITKIDADHFSLDGTTGPITITIVAHGYATGNHIFIDGVGEASTWTSGGTAADSFQTSRAFFCMASSRVGSGGYENTWRKNPSANDGAVFVCHNQYSWAKAPSNNDPIPLYGMQSLATNDGPFTSDFVGGRSADIEPWCGWSLSAYGARPTIVLQLPDAFLSMDSVKGDQEDPSIDGRKWIALTDRWSTNVGSFQRRATLFLTKP